jgi:hypothetical protein
VKKRYNRIAHKGKVYQKKGNYILDAHKTSYLLALDKSSDLIYNNGTLAIRLTKQ